MTRHPSKPRALRPVKTTRDSTRRWTRSGRGRDLDLRDKRGSRPRSSSRSRGHVGARERVASSSRALVSGGAKSRATARTAPTPLRRPARCDARAPSRAFVNPQKNALATARPPQVGRVVSLPLETTRRRGAPSGRSPTVVTSRDVGSATRRAGFDGASASASRLREAAEVVSAMDATLERARVMENGAAGGADGSRGGRATNRAGAVEVPAHGDGLDGAECARGPRGRVISG